MNTNPLYNTALILMEESKMTKSEFGHEYERVMTVLEDANSPINSKYKEKLYKSVINKGHIDFGGIPTSKGNIRDYAGYKSMIDTLGVIIDLGTAEKSNVVEYANTIMEAIKNIESLADVYKKGFESNTEYVILEYNTYVYTCVEATTALIYEFVDYVKRPDKPTYVITLKNTKHRANLFYFEQLASFNNVNKNMHVNYRKMLENMINQEKKNFTGSEFIGLATLSIVALAVVPITRELIYHFYNLRSKISDELAIQAKFLEMNRTCVEANSALTEEKKRSILKKQEGIRNVLLKASEKLRVKEVKVTKDSKRDIEKDNQLLTINEIRDEVSNSPLVVL